MVKLLKFKEYNIYIPDIHTQDRFEDITAKLLIFLRLCESLNLSIKEVTISAEKYPTAIIVPLTNVEIDDDMFCEVKDEMTH